MLVGLATVHVAMVAALPPVVVTGATGRVGSAVVRSLIERRGSAENIFVLARDVAKANAMHADVQCLSAAYDDVAALSTALSSMPAGYRLFLACSNSPTQADLESNVCNAAHSSGCEYVVKLSTASAVLEMKEGGPYAAHLRVEELLAQLDMPHAVLRPNLFMDELVGAFLGVSSLRSSDSCVHPFAESPISMVDTRDVAECAASLLLAAAPDPCAKYDVTGPSAVTLSADLAGAIKELSGREVTITPCTVDEYLAPRGLPPPVSASLGGFFSVLMARCAAATDVVQTLTGRAPRGIGQFVQDHAADFSANQQPE